MSSLGGITYVVFFVILAAAFSLILYYVVKWAVRDGIMQALEHRSTAPLVDKLLTQLRAPESPR